MPYKIITDSINAIVDSDDTVKEKIKRLESYNDFLLKEISKSVEKGMKQIKKGYRYCPKCEQYYREDTFSHVSSVEETQVFRTTAEHEKDITEDLLVIATYDVCPAGHKILINKI